MKKLIIILFIGLLQNASGQLSFHWRQYSGPVTGKIQNADTSTTEVTGLDQVGVYGFELTVTSDSTGLSGKDSMTVTVISGTLGIEQDSVYHIDRPKITRLYIKTAVNGDKIYMIIKSPRQQKLKCVLLNSVGQMLATTDIFLKEGINYVSLPKPRLPGVYILHFSGYFDDAVVKQIMI